MGTIVDKLNIILNTKNNFKQKFNEKGVTVDDSVPFSEYPNKMDELSGGDGLINTSVAQQIKKAVMPNNIFYQQEIINSANAEIETA